MNFIHKIVLYICYTAALHIKSHGFFFTKNKIIHLIIYAYRGAYYFLFIDQTAVAMYVKFFFFI